MSPARITVYNPDLLGRDDLVAGFVARRALLARILEDMRRPHPLIGCWSDPAAWASPPCCAGSTSRFTRTRH